MKFDIWASLKNLSKKIEFSLKYENNGGYSREDQCAFIISRSVYLRMIYVSDKSCIENLNTQFMFYNVFHKFVLFMR